MAEPYRFSDPAGLDQRFWHSYVPYAGVEFVTGWWDDRERARATLPPACPPPVSCAILPEAAPYDGEAVMEWLWVQLPSGNAVATAAFSRLLGRFEVVRKVALAYQADFKPVDTAPRGTLAAHIRLAECFARAHHADGFLGTLNVLVKAVDTLIALAPGMDDALKARLHGLILAERAAIAQLGRRIGVGAVLPC